MDVFTYKPTYESYSNVETGKIERTPVKRVVFRENTELTQREMLPSNVFDFAIDIQEQRNFARASNSIAERLKAQNLI